MSNFTEQIMTEEVENQERRCLRQNYAGFSEREEKVGRNPAQTKECQSPSAKAVMEKRMKGCSNWAYYLTIFLLSAFIVSTFLLQVQANYRHTQKFVSNIAQLRNSVSSKSHQLPQKYTLHHLLPSNPPQNKPQLQYSGQVQSKINFKPIQVKPKIAPQVWQNNENLAANANIPAPMQPSRNPEQFKANAQAYNPNSNYVVPQNAFIPYAPSIDQLRREPQPSLPVIEDLGDFQPQLNYVQNAPTPVNNVNSISNSNANYLMTPSSAPNSYIKVQNTLSPFGVQMSKTFSNLITPSPSFTVNQQFESTGNIEKPKDSQVHPIIFPFNNLPANSNDYGFQGSFSSITNTQISNARRFRMLVENDEFVMDKLAQQEKTYYEQRYNIGKYGQLPFCIVVPTYNNVNKDRYLKNIKSIVMQDYKNFHIVVIDDASTDSTGALIKKYLDNQKYVAADRYKILTNSFQLKAMPNLRNAAMNHCKPQQIFLIVDGDDQLLGRQVLKLYNSVFQEKQLWFVYSNFLSMSGGVGFSRPFPVRTMTMNSYRTYPFVTSHLRAFYTKLFRNIKEEDLKDQKGEYLRAANDVAICIPILEQAHERVGYLPELTYYYNSNTGLNNHQVRLTEQQTNDKMVRRHASYKRLDKLFD